MLNEGENMVIRSVDGTLVLADAAVLRRQNEIGFYLEWLTIVIECASQFICCRRTPAVIAEAVYKSLSVEWGQSADGRMSVGKRRKVVCVMMSALTTCGKFVSKLHGDINADRLTER